MRTVYLDHAATSWPKPPGVAEAMADAVVRHGGNPGRGAYRLAVDTARAIHAARGSIARFLGVNDSRNLLFQPGCTQAMNLVLHGLIGPQDRVIACPTEHNAVSRPLNRLAASGTDVVLVEGSENGIVDVDDVEALLAARPTRAVVCQHAGNVTGAIQHVADLADVAHAHGALLLVDGAQAGGHLPVDLSTLGADAWACSGHKGLLGPQGIGVLYLSPDIDPTPLVSGGTGGGASDEPMNPEVRPDRYEAGTPNTPGILGLAAAVDYLAENAAALRAEEQRLAARLHEGVTAMGGYRVLGPDRGEERVPVVSLTHESVEADRIAYLLDRSDGIASRAGLHCAPWAHRELGTLESGALRLSVGYGNTEADTDLVLEALARIAQSET